jgi:hypothetical protein
LADAFCFCWEEAGERGNSFCWAALLVMMRPVGGHCLFHC